MLLTYSNSSLSQRKTFAESIEQMCHAKACQSIWRVLRDETSSKDAGLFSHPFVTHSHMSSTCQALQPASISVNFILPRGDSSFRGWCNSFPARTADFAEFPQRALLSGEGHGWRGSACSPRGSPRRRRRLHRSPASSACSPRCLRR